MLVDEKGNKIGGRPPKKEEEKRSVVVKFRVTKSEKKQIVENAKLKQLSITDHLRNLTLLEEIDHAPTLVKNLMEKLYKYENFLRLHQEELGALARFELEELNVDGIDIV